MPQPLKGSCNQELNSIDEHPVLAACIGRIIAKWSVIEYYQSNILSLMLGSDAAIGSTLFGAVKADAARSAMLQAIAEEKLNPEALTEYTALNKRYKNTTKFRDAIAHNLWGTSKEHPECLIMIDSRDQSKWMAYLTASLSSDRPSFQDHGKPSPLENSFESMRVYNEKDFLDAETAIKDLSVALSQFSYKLRQLAPSRRLLGMK